MTIKRHLKAGFALVIAVGALSGSALAAPPSAPPGQEKKAEEADPATAATQAAPPADNGNASAPGQEKKAAKAAVKTTGINSTTEGVKPANDTDKDTWTTAGASPDVSKRYGNGTTAAQIATSRGAPAITPIHGPGNSQPHKVCGKNGNWVDVHAVKSYTNVCAEAARRPTGGVPTVGATPPSITAVAPGVTGAAIGAAAGSAAVTPAGGVAGAEHAEAGGVAGALDVLGESAGGALPFTGFPLWTVALAGLVAIVLGWALWRRGAPETRDLV
jgi:hypothetical protein